jgi:hypothetical protein
MEPINTTYLELKRHLTGGAQLKWIDADPRYFVYAIDPPFTVMCCLQKGSADAIDFENNLKADHAMNSNITTQFEKRDKTVKLSCAEALCDSTTGLATILLKIPGTPGSGDGRWISGGHAWLGGDWNSGDKIVGVWFTDEDNILGMGAGATVASYTDDEVDSANRGWFIPKNPSTISVEAIGGYGFAPAGFYLKIVGRKGGTGPFTGIDLYVNLEWGKTEA